MPTVTSVSRLFLFIPLLVQAATNVQLSSTPNASVYGSPVTLAATVLPATATGKVTFYDGTIVIGTSPVNSGQASISTILLDPGSRAIRAFYSGDANNPAATATLTQIVNATADGGFGTPPTSFGALAIPESVLVADFNRDGKSDLAVATYSGIAILLGSGEGTFQENGPISTGSVPQSLASGDLNGDGNTDLVVTSQSGGISVLLGNGNGTFQNALNTPFASSDLVYVAVGDFNGDGNADLAVVDDTNDRIDILLGNGDGTFGSPVSYAVGNAPDFVTVADVNGDGNADLAAANSEGNDISVLLGNGNGTFQTAVNYATGANPNSIAVADLNGDGKADLAVANMGGGLSVLIGNGDGTFRTQTSLSIGLEPVSVTALDFNGDGKMDLAVVDYSSDTVAVLLGNGDGTFQPTIDVPGGANPNFVAVGDFNGDGRPDLAVTSFSGQNVGVILGTPKNALGCGFVVNVSTPQTLPASGGSITITIQTGSTCAWEVAGLPDWITAMPSSTGTGSSTVTLVVAANSGAARSAELDAAFSPGMVSQLSNILSINTNGVVNAASYSATVAPGSIATVFGDFVAAGPTSATSTPIPTSLSGLSVEFGGATLAPLFYASLEQVNIQVPWELAGQTQTTIVSSFSGQTSIAQTVNVAAYAPGLFDVGAGQGAILNSNFQVVNASAPAAVGDYVQIYCTGLGPVTNQPATGSPAPSIAPFSETMVTPTVTIGGVPATVVYSGLAPGSVGEYQINAQVPAGSITGDLVQVAVTIGGVTSNIVTMAVQ